MTATATPSRYLRPLSERSYAVLDGGVRKGTVWCEAGAQDERRWRASDPSGLAEWRPWAFYATPQAAALACVREYDSRAR